MSNNDEGMRLWSERGLAAALGLHDVDAEAIFRYRLLCTQVNETGQPPVLSKLTALHLRTGQQEQARCSLRDIILDHLNYGQDWQLLGAVEFNARTFPELVGGAERCVAVLSMAYHHPDTLNRYREEIDADLPKFEQRLGRDAFAAAWARGKTMQLEATVRELLSGQQTSPGAAG